MLPSKCSQNSVKIQLKMQSKYSQNAVNSWSIYSLKIFQSCLILPLCILKILRTLLSRFQLILKYYTGNLTWRVCGEHRVAGHLNRLGSHDTSYIVYFLVWATFTVRNLTLDCKNALYFLNKKQPPILISFKVLCEIDTLHFWWIGWKKNLGRKPSYCIPSYTHLEYISVTQNAKKVQSSSGISKRFYEMTIVVDVLEIFEGDCSFLRHLFCWIFRHWFVKINDRSFQLRYNFCMFKPKKTKCIKYPLITFFASQLQLNLAAIVADMEARNSKFVSQA